MTLAHRITAAYAIVITSLLVGLAQGNRHMLKLEKENITYTLGETERGRIIAHISVPYLTGGAITALLFLVLTRSNKVRK